MRARPELNMAYGLACQDQHLVFLQIGCGSIKSSPIDFLTNWEATRCTTCSLHRADNRLLSCKLSTKIHFIRYHTVRPGCLFKWKFSYASFIIFFAVIPSIINSFLFIKIDILQNFALWPGSTDTLEPPVFTEHRFDPFPSQAHLVYAAEHSLRRLYRWPLQSLHQRMLLVAVIQLSSM